MRRIFAIAFIVCFLAVLILILAMDRIGLVHIQPSDGRKRR